MIFRRSVTDAAEPPRPGDAADGDGQAADETAVTPSAGTTPESDGSPLPPDESEPDATAVADPDPAEPGEDEATAVVGTQNHEHLETEATNAVDPDAETAAAPADDPDATAVREPEVGPVDEVPIGEAAPAVPKKRKRGRRVLLGVGIPLVLLAGAYAGASWYFGDKVPQNTTVAGVDLSGMTATEATDALESQLADVLVEPVPVTMGDATTTIDPVAAGLRLDAAATVARFTGFTFDPRVVLGHLFGLGEQEPVIVTDEAALDAALAGAATELDLAPVDGVLEFVDGAGQVTTEPADGLSLDVASAAADLPQQWLTAQRPFELPSETTTPAIDDAAIDAAQTDIVDPLLSAPVTLQLNDEETELSPEQLAAAATLSPDGGSLSLVLDGERLAEVVTKAVPSIGETPEDARIVLKGGKPRIIPAVTGTGLDPDQLATVLAAAAVATDPEERVATAELAETEPDFSTEDAEELGVVEVVSSFSTPYPYDPTRTQNLINGTANISGTLIKPGETFSLIEALGPITIDNGYVSSHVVENGNVTDALGGGLSQVSTTTFNAAYEAGMEDIQHKPHSRWFDRYPAGREATMFAPDLDMQWGNNTPYGVLVQAWVDESTQRVHVQLWSTEYWDVDITSSSHYNITSPRTIYNERDECTPESAGPSGFTIDINRTVARGGEVNEQYSGGYSWTYSPWNRIVCGPPPSEDDDDSDDDEG